MKRLSATKARDNLPDLINRAAYRGDRIVIEKHGKPMAAIISFEDLRLLERILEQEDHEDIQDAKTALAEPGDNLPWDELKRDLNL